MNKAWEIRDKLFDVCKRAGFNYVAIDLVGYRTGSMNEALSDAVKKTGSVKSSLNNLG